MEGVETIFSRPTRAIEDSTGAVSTVALDNRELTQAHRYVLFNSENIHQFREMHIRLIEDELRSGRCRTSNDTIHKHHMEKFCGWFRCHVMSMTDADRESTGLTDTLITLSKGPYTSVNRLKHYVINELKFRSANVEGNRKTQNSGVSVATEARDVFDAGIGPHCDEDDTDEFLENILYSLTSTDVGTDDLRWGRDNVEGMTIDASIIGPRDLHEMDNLDECEFIDDESNDEDTNDVEYSDEE
nr:hypothetical protein CFP56_76621 [Quercus suber]